MATVDDGDLVFYPAFYFKASPTHFAWVKMAAVDVHRLKRRPGFEGMYSNSLLLTMYLCVLVSRFVECCE